MYLVTGAAGFIGSSIVRALNERGIDDILAVDDLRQGDHCRNLCDCTVADYMDRAELIDAIDRNTLPRLTAICHQGACADTMETDGQYMMRNNFTWSKRLLETAVDARIPFVYASSAAVYGAGERFNVDPACERPLNVYAFSKLVFDQHVRKVPPAASTIVGLRYFNVYGPREGHKGRMASMVYQLHRQLAQTGVARLFAGSDGYADGEQRRDFVFVGDVVNVNLFFLQQPQPVRGIFNVGAGRSRSFNDVARCLIQRLGTGAIEYTPMPASLRGKYQNFTEADLSTLRAAGYTAAMTTLEDGISACCEHWNNEPWPRDTVVTTNPVRLPADTKLTP